MQHQKTKREQAPAGTVAVVSHPVVNMSTRSSVAISLLIAATSNVLLYVLILLCRCCRFRGALSHRYLLRDSQTTEA